MPDITPSGQPVAGGQATWLLPTHAAEVMAIYGFPDGIDCPDDLWWRTIDGAVMFFAKCSDMFMWACADLEPIHAEDMPLLRECRRVLDELGSSCLLSELYACRKRGKRPMKVWLDEEVGDKLRAIFEACGPEVVDPWHPKEPAARPPEADA